MSRGDNIVSWLCVAFIGACAFYWLFAFDYDCFHGVHTLFARPWLESLAHCMPGGVEVGKWQHLS